ncbi:hypothetical protein MNBD_NITROSPINAE03-1116 [hydrothermal vent metagenome]|uniref:Phosphate-selective porin O and P n=1 Tax=hydrothermal vent metagenome TaxID=652676 RepID=A0A3B1BTU5_9ZZZZ
MRRIKSFFVMAVAAMAMFGFQATPASAVEIADGQEMYGWAQWWLTLQEDTMAATDVLRGTGEKSGDTLFGVAERRARIGFKGKLADGMVRYNVLTEWAGSTFKLNPADPATQRQGATLLDYWMSLHPMGDALEIRVGRFKPFITYEAGVASSRNLLMLDRSLAMKSINSGFFGADYEWRDLGIMLKYNVGPAQLIYSISNGVGGAQEGGGSYFQRQRAFRSNDFVTTAAHSFGVIVNPMAGLRLNASYSFNKHNNSSVIDAVVVDVDRSVYSVGFEFNSETGFYADGEYASLKVETKDDFALLGGVPGTRSGYYVRAGFWVIPKSLILTARYENFKNDPDGGISAEDTLYTGAAMYILGPTRITLEYTSADGDSNEMSTYSSTDPTTLRARFQVAF